ncbi:glutaminase kidney isoform, mitochondrial-like isoform X1 [Mya arenaria]|uniref:glutaminase kidney isoform, mitochondrial-like isoform X1 n=1 Tax=Mya arenaria TaxID=6604 RepID=UPI0022DEA09D|nr:glutaminase kidney isoform, mitochondrial-like isoform X1 [Mya arenaria]
MEPNPKLLKRRPSNLKEWQEGLEELLASGMEDFEEKLFSFLCDHNHLVSIDRFKNLLDETGLREMDFRLRETMRKFRAVLERQLTDEHELRGLVDKDTFIDCVSDNIVVISKALTSQFVIPEFKTFTDIIDTIYETCKDNDSGLPAQYIPQLARVDPSHWGVSICTIDGQRYDLGETSTPFCMQSVVKPLNYALTLNDLSSEVVHQYVGQEPSGRSFNELTLDYQHKPHNPMINAGAIVTAGLLKKGLVIADRFDYAMDQFKRLSGQEHIAFNNSVYLSERATADRNFALGYYMRENKCFPPEADLVETLEFYFQLCSVEITAESGAVIAATLANGGICPTTGDRVLDSDAVRNTLSLMHSCGMYDYSGQFAFKVGLPAKSGVAGGVMLVVPNLMGIFTWSPPLDQWGNSSRGVQFCEELVGNFNFHNYDNLRHTSRKYDPRGRAVESKAQDVVNLLFSAYNGDVTAMRRYALLGMDMSLADYDGRTALHLASAEGHEPIVRFLLEKCNVSSYLRDRWGFTPYHDAKRFKHDAVSEVLLEHMKTTAPKDATFSIQDIDKGLHNMHL